MDPWRCSRCGKKLGVACAGLLITIHHGRTIRITLPAGVVQQCDRCGGLNEWQGREVKDEREATSLR